MKYTVTEFRKNIREILDAVDHGAEVTIVRYDKEYLILNAVGNSPMYGVDPTFSQMAQQPESEILTKTRHDMAKAVGKGRDKQAELMGKDIVSDLDMSLEDNKFKVTVTPNKEKTAAHIKEKFGTKPTGISGEQYSSYEKKKAPKGVEPVDSCPHGFAKGFCKKADCNRKYQK